MWILVVPLGDNVCYLLSNKVYADRNVALKDLGEIALRRVFSEPNVFRTEVVHVGNSLYIKYMYYMNGRTHKGRSDLFSVKEYHLVS